MKWTIIFVVLLTVSLAKPLRKSRHRRPPHKCLPAPVLPGDSIEASIFASPTPSAEALSAPIAPSEASSLAEVSPTVSADLLLASIPPSGTTGAAEVPPTPRNEVPLASEMPYIGSSPAKESEPAVFVTTMISLSENFGNSEGLIETSAPNTVNLSQPTLPVTSELPLSAERAAEPEELSITTEAAAAEKVSGDELEISTMTEISSFGKLEESSGITPAETEFLIVSDMSSKSEELTATTAVLADTKDLSVTTEASSISEIPSAERSGEYRELVGTNPAEAESSDGKSEELTATTAVSAGTEDLRVTTEPSLDEPEVSSITELPSSSEGSCEFGESISTTIAEIESSNVFKNNHEPEIASAQLASSESSASETPKTFSLTSGQAEEVDELPVAQVVSEDISVESHLTSVAPEASIPTEKLSSAAPLEFSVSPLSSTPSSKNSQQAETPIVPKLSEESNKNLIASSPPTKPQAPLKRFLTFTFFDRDANNTSLKHFLNYLRSLKK